jgi:NADP-dependent 3-hydroxy acid dehydrogenase YdfG/Tfp pilus assembly protein PilF
MIVKHTSQVHLVYCEDNQHYATQLSQDLASVIDWHLISAGKDSPVSLADQLQGVDGPIILLVSDNFLRSAMCMHQCLSMLNDHQHQLLPVVVPGHQVDLQTREVETVHTSFDRVSDIIQYINYWQDRYLDLRRQKREDPELDDDGFNQHLKLVRDISSEAGEALRLLRSIYHLKWEEFNYAHYEQLFIFLDDKATWEAFVAQQPSTPEASTGEEEPSLEVDLRDIPGVSLLGGSVLPAEAGETPAEEEATDMTPMAEPLPETGEEMERPEPSTPGPEPGVETPAPEEEEEEEEEAVAEKTEPISEVIVDEDDQVAALIRKAWAHVDEGAFENGLTLLSAGFESLPARMDLRYHYAVIQTHEGNDLDAAREQVQIILHAEPENEDTLFLAAEIADLQHEPEHARHYLEEVLALNSDYPDAWYRLGILLVEHFPEDEEEALRAFKKAIRKDEENADAYYQAALLYKNRESKTKKAVKYLKRAIKTDPSHSFAHYDLALLYHQAGERKKAYEAYREAAALNPEFSTAENDRAFNPRAAVPARPTAGQAGQDTLAALKSNVAHLEELLRQQEKHAREVKQRPGTGRIALVSGATSGIGRATAEALARAGYRVIITGRRADRLAALKAEWEAAYDTDILPLIFDVRSASAVEQAIATLPPEWQAIDLLINNAGKAKGLDYIHEGQLEHWEEMIDTNIKGLLYLTRVISKGMVARGRGHIINVASTAGKEVYPRGNVYCATKHAVDALTKSMRIDLHTHGIRVSQVAPAHVEETEFALVRFDGDNEKARIYEDFKPLTSSDVAETILFIAQQPPHVNILDVVLQGTQQANSLIIDRSGRDRFEEEE